MKFKPLSPRPTMAVAGGAAAGAVGAAEIPLNFEALTLSIIIAGMGVAIVIANIIIISAFLNFKALVPGLANEVINYYLLSLAVADLLCGALVVPLSVYPAFTGNGWNYGETVCRVVGYIEVTLWSVSVFTFMWISVDRYLAVRKPLRYETVQTRTRCQCWMVFTWISSAMLCCPPLLGFNKPVFDPQTYICMLDWGSTAAYTATLIVMVMGPSVISVVHNYYYIFAMMRKIRSGVPIHDKEYATALAENLSNPTHMMSFVLVLTFALSWGPYAGVRVYEYFNGGKLQIPFLHFGVVWLGIMNSFWKIIILFTLSPQFRLAFRILCLSVCCRGKGRLQAILIGLDQDD